MTSNQSGGLSSPDPPQRAAELRQKLIAMRKSSATPPNTSSNIPTSRKPLQQAEAPNSHPRGPSGFTTPAQPGDTDLEDLLSEARSKVDSVVNGGMTNDTPIKTKNDKANDETLRPTSQTSLRKATPTGPTRETQTSTGSYNKVSSRGGGRSSGEASDISDGEIVDSPNPRRPLPPTGPKESELSVVKRKLADEAARDRRDELMNQSEKPAYHAPIKMHRSPTRASGRPVAPIHGEERSSTSDSRPNSRKPYHDGGSTERVEQKRHERKEERDPLPAKSSEPMTETKNDPVKAKSPQPVPLLDRVLAENDDLRQWLELTKWHDVENRASKIKQYQEFLELCKVFGQAPSTGETGKPKKEGTMLPPPTSTKVNDGTNDAVQEKATNAHRSEPGSGSAAEPIVIVKKRSRDADEDDHGREEKFARTDADGRGVKIKSGGSNEYGRADAPRRSYRKDTNPYYKHEDAKSGRRSLSPRYNRPDSRDSGRGFADRGRGYNYSDNDESRTFDNRTTAKTFERDRDLLPKIDNDDWKSRRMSEALEPGREREYVVRGAYRGKSYDPNYHENRGRGGFVYRGRGRGRGYAAENSHDNFHARSHGNGSVSRPKGYKEPWDKGDKGGQ